MEELTLAYTAGLIDGEGYIGLIPNCRVHTSLIPKVKVASVSPEIVEFLHLTFGGHLDKARQNKGNRKESYMWSLSNKIHVYKFLMDLRPYLRLKFKQADLICDYCQQCTYAEMRNKKTKQSATEKRMWFYNQIRLLNHRGITVAETK